MATEIQKSHDQIVNQERAIFTKIEAQLAWRGPNGRAMGHVVLERNEAVALLAALGVTMSDDIAKGR